MSIKTIISLFSVLITSLNFNSVNCQNTYIFGGTPTQITEVPWQVSIELNGAHHCGGSIINNEWIVSAAHCFADLSGPFMVHAGATDQTNNSIGQRILVNEVIIHPNYVNFLNGYDIAMIRLSTPLCFNESVQPIQLVDPNSVISVGTTAIISGWGATNNSSASSVLLSASIPLISDEDATVLINNSNNLCPPNFAFEIGNSTAAFYSPGIAAGGGDSGGPAVIDIDGEPKLIGAASWAGGCPIENFPTLYADFRAAHNFINSTSSVQTTTIEINTSQTLNLPVINGTLKIKAPSVLTINSEVKLTNNSIILVEDGAKIIIDGGKLTSCNSSVKWKGLRVFGNIFTGQNHGVEMKNGSIIENAEIGISTSNIVPGFFLGTFFNLSGSKITTENSTFNNCDVGIEVGPYGYSNLWFSWYDQSKILGSNFQNCEIGIKLISNIGVEVSETTFSSSVEVGISSENSVVNVNGSSFYGNSAMNFISAYPNLIGSNITENNIFSTKGIYISSQGNMAEFNISNNVFGGEDGVILDGNSSFNIGGNNFVVSNIGVISKNTGGIWNRIETNEFLGNNYSNCIYGNNKIEFLTNCFNYSSITDLEINDNSSIFDAQGNEAFSAGNCFSNINNKIITSSTSQTFSYYLKNATTISSCKYPGQGNFTLENAIEDNVLNCGNNIWGTLPPNYRNCIIPFNLQDKLIMEKAIKAEIERLKKDTNISSKLKSWLISKHLRCLKILKESIFKNFILQENSKEVAINYYLLQDDFNDKLTSYSFLVMDNDYASAYNILNNFEYLNLGQFYFIEASKIYLNYLKLSNTSIYDRGVNNLVKISNSSKDSLFHMASFDSEYKGYIKGIYYILTNELLPFEITHLNNTEIRSYGDEPSSLIKSYPNPLISNELFIDIPKNKNKSGYNVKIFDQFNNLKLEKVCFEGKNELNLSNCNNGLYFVEVFKDNTPIYIYRFVKVN